MSRIPFRKKHLAVLTASILGLSVLAGCGADGDDGTDGVDGVNGTDGVDGADGQDGITNYIVPGLKRLVTAPLGAEITGLYLNSDGSLFMNFQHPSSSNTIADANGKVYDKATVGVVAGADFSSIGDFPALDMPITSADKELPQLAVGSYQVLGQQDDAVGGVNLGDIIAKDGTTVLKNSNDPDFNGVIPHPTNAGEFYLYSNWEDRPGGMSRILVGARDAATGYATVTPEGMLDFSSVEGTWVNCFGTVSPWQTPLSSEELYFDNTAEWFDPQAPYFSNAQDMSEYLGYPTDGSGNWANPYRYGYILEVGADVTTDGVYTADAASLAGVELNKLEAMGRFSHENSVVMPDQRTVFLSDDGTGTVFFKFVADTAGDLSSGTLYAAKVTQSTGTTDPSEAAFAIEWIELAHGVEADIESWIAEYDGTFAESKYITGQQINDWAEAKLNQDLDGSGSVAASPFTDDRPAFLESRKAAVALGATGEFRKMEGVNINYAKAADWYNGVSGAKQPYMYMAMSSFDKTMSDGEGDIQLDGANGKCGVVYRMKLVNNAGLVDVAAMYPAIVGGPYYGDRLENQCNVNNISNPDNLLIMDDGRVIIGEDTGNHETNMVWVFDDPAI